MSEVVPVPSENRRATLPLRVAFAGRVAYRDALAWQEALVASCAEGAPDALLLLEHPPVYTLGRGADERFLGAVAAGGAEVIRVSRGGQVTWHGPGQLVGYPILDLRRHRQDVHWYVRALEAVLITALAALGIAAERRPGYPGVWTGGRKIASIGVGIRRWVTWHGFALNVACDLQAFEAIVPCGIPGVRMTSIVAEAGAGDMEVVARLVLAAMLEEFGFTAWEPLSAPPWLGLA